MDEMLLKKWICTIVATEEMKTISPKDNILSFSIPGIVWTIYALLSNFQTYVQLENFSYLLLYVLWDCCTFYIKVIITVKTILFNWLNTNQLSSDWFSETKKQ